MLLNTKSDLNLRTNTQEEVFHSFRTWHFDKHCIRYSGGLVALLYYVRSAMLIYLALLLVPVVLHAQPLIIEPSELDLGTIKIGAETQGEIHLTNLENDEVEIVIESGGNGFAATPDTLHLAGKAAGTISVYFSSTTPGPVSETLALRVKSFFKDETFTVALQAAADYPTLSLSPATGLDFGAVQIGDSTTNAIHLKNTGIVAATFGEIALADPQAPFSIQQTTSLPGPGGEQQLQIIFAPQRSGSFATDLIVTSPDFDALSIPLQGQGLAPKAASSPLPEVGIDFGTVELGQRPSRRVTLLNQGQAVLRVKEATIEDAAFALAGPPLPASVAPADRLELSVIFGPQNEGDKTSTLHLGTDDPENSNIEIPLRGRAQISPPHIEVLNGTVIDFSSVPIGKTARDHLLLWNRGGSPFAVQMNLSADEDVEFNLTQSSVLLQPGTSAKVTLGFSPKEIGPRQATLSVRTQAGTQTLRLQGIGQFLKLSPSTVDFGQVAVGENSSKIIEIANIGNADLNIHQIRSTSDDFTLYTKIDPNNKFLLPANSLRALPLHVAFSPSGRGTISGNLHIDGFWEEGMETLDILLNGNGVAAEIELHPKGVVDFGYVVLGERSEQTIVATNAGDTVLQVESHPQDKEAYIEPAKFALAPGESTRLKVFFAPERLGERLGRVLLVSNDVKDRARPLKYKGHGALENIDLARITQVMVSRGEISSHLGVGWNNAPIVQKDGTKIDIAFHIPDSLRQALVGREITIEWTKLDQNYDPKGGAQQKKVKIYESSGERVLAEDLNLRLLEKDNRRVRVKITTQGYPGAPPQSISQVFEAGGWKWEFEAKPLISFLTIRPGRDYTATDGTVIKGKTERLIGLPGLAFAGWHNVDNPSISGVHFTAIGNVLEALSTENSLAISMGLAVSFYKDQFLFGFGWDVYDNRSKAKRKGSQDYIMTFKYSGLFK